MNKLKIIASCSIVANIVLVIALYSNYRVRGKENAAPLHHISRNEGLSISHFEKIYIEKNDSTYKVVFNKQFQDFPIQAYLLACTYYMLKKDSSVKNDIEMISTEIKGIYGKSPDVYY